MIASLGRPPWRVEALVLVPAAGCDIATQALRLPENLPHVARRSVTLHGRHGPRVAQEHDCFVITITDEGLDADGRWRFALASLLRAHGLYLPDPGGEKPIDSYLVYGYRPDEVVSGPELFMRVRPGTARASLLDPLTQEEHESGAPEALEGDTRYLRRLRYLTIGSYEFDVHMLGAEVDSISVPDPDILRQVSYPVLNGSLEKEFRPTKHVLGKGSFGTVRIAKGVRTGIVVACKEMVFDRRRPGVEAYMRHALHERELSISLRHRNVVHTIFGDTQHDHDPSTGEVIFTRHRIMMDPCPFSLDDMITVDLAKDHLLRAAVDVAGGLSFIHGQGIAHRDLKPGNIL
ncbi:kinase-like domain-containing protein, partial [Elsinoe ampelina]